MHRRTALSLLAMLVVMIVATTACGYALVGRGSNLPVDIRAIYISPLGNRTTTAQVEQILGVAIAEEMVLRQRFDVTTSEAGADAVLEGSILGVRLIPVTFNEQGFAEDFEISIRAFMLLRRTDEDKTILWANPEYDFRESYELDLGGDTGVFEREIQAVEDLASVFAKSLITDLMEGF